MRLIDAGRLYDLIDPGRTIALFRRIIEPIVDPYCLRRITQAQMWGLVLLVVGVRNEHRGEPIESDPPVRSGVADRSRRACRDQLEMVGMVVKSPGGGAAQDIGVKRRIGQAGPQAPAEARSN